ncbi:hypothetical protein [Blastococcus sp. SYSU D00820]
MALLRRIGAVVLAVAAVVVWYAMAPEELGDSSAAIREALSDYERNEANTSGAPQQQVVNGWVAKDLLTIIAEQQNESVTDERLPALAGLAVLGLALHIATTPRADAVPDDMGWSAAGPDGPGPQQLPIDWNARPRG